MYRFNIIAPDDLKESYLIEGCADYLGRLRRSASVRVKEYRESPLREGMSDAEIVRALDAEGERILALRESRDYLVALCVEGKSLTSERLARTIGDVFTSGYPELTFAIGSSFGMSEKVKSAAGLKLSLSALTFPHRLVRLLLTEALYRSTTILEGRRYHK